MKISLRIILLGLLFIMLLANESIAQNSFQKLHAQSVDLTTRSELNGNHRIDSFPVFFGRCGDVIRHRYKRNQVADTLVYDTIRLCYGDSVLLQGVYQFASGSYFDTMVVNGFDSVIATTLIALPPDFTDYDLEICDDDSVFAAGTYQNTTGVYYDSLVNSNGCDSVIRTILLVRSTYTFPVYQSICQGDSFFVGGAYQYNSGIYYDTINSTFGCDSVLLTQLQVDTVTISYDSISICSGDSIFIFGQYVHSPGLYTDTTLSIGGCDSVVNTVISVTPSQYIKDSIKICPGDSILINGIYEFSQGTYFDSLQSALGCDSVIEIFVMFHQVPLVTIDFNDPIISASPNTFQTFQWYQNNQPIPGAIYDSYEIFSNGNFHTVVTDSNSCVGLSDTLSIVNLSNSSKRLENAFVNVLNLQDQFRIMNLSKEVTSYSLLTIDGKLMFTSNLGNLRLRKEDFAKGIYILRVHGKDGLLQAIRLPIF